MVTHMKTSCLKNVVNLEINYRQMQIVLAQLQSFPADV